MTGLSRVGVVGASGVGPPLAQACLQAGLSVVLVDDTSEVLSNAESAVLRGLQRAEQPGAFSLMRTATRLDALEGCDLVVECGTETPQAKQDLLRRIDSWTERSAVIAVETDALPVSFTARYVENPERVVGVHVPPPATIGRLVEVIGYEHAAEASMERALAWVERLGKTAVRTRDKAGFVVNRLQRAWMNAALRILEEGGGTPATLDAAMRSEGGFPAGPFELMDSRGLTEDYSIGETIYELLGRAERLKPSPVHQQLLARGCRGRRALSGPRHGRNHRADHRPRRPRGAFEPGKRSRQQPRQPGLLRKHRGGVPKQSRHASRGLRRKRQRKKRPNPRLHDHSGGLELPARQPRGRHLHRRPRHANLQ